VTLAGRLSGLIRLVHPFPSILDGVVVGAVALLAGAAGGDALRLGLAMTLLQFGIGATNDLVDAKRDAGQKPGKPIPRGLVRRDVARAVAVGAFGAGLGLAALSGPGLAALAVAVIAIGLAYDLRLKGTPWSWLPFAVGIPILPVFGWLAATDGRLPDPFLVLVPAAILAGAALAIANALADVERDRAAGVASIATELGAFRAWLLHAALLGTVLVAAVVSVLAFGGSPGEVGLVVLAGLVAAAGAATAQGGGPTRRERGWEAEAIGVALVAIAWTWAVLV
jgi:4-hydroxybenzoate polyprenyltransferase